MRDLAEWQQEVVNFLRSHRKYRFCGREYGYKLIVSQWQEQEYRQRIKYSSIHSLAIATSLGLVTLAITRQRKYAAIVAGSSLLTLIVLSFSLLKKYNNQPNEEECLVLLQELEQLPLTPALEEQRENYLYDYYQLRGTKMVWDKKLLDILYKISWQRAKQQPDEQPVEEAEEVAEQSESLGKDNFIQRLCKFSEEGSTLGEIMAQINCQWLTAYCDRSLNVLVDGTKTMEQHDEYVKGLLKGKVQKLSLHYHPDKVVDSAQKQHYEEIQKNINRVMKAVRNIHSFVMTNYGRILRDYTDLSNLRTSYQMYDNFPLSILDDAQYLAALVEKSMYKGFLVLENLARLGSQEAGYLMEDRNYFLEQAEAALESLVKKTAEIAKDPSYDKLSALQDGIVLSWNSFNEEYARYVTSYQKEWVDYVRRVYEEYHKEGLVIISSGLQEMLTDSYEQHELLMKKSYSSKAHEDFVMPMILYHRLMKTCYDFAVHLLTEIKNCYYPVDEKSMFSYLYAKKSPPSMKCKQAALGEIIAIFSGKQLSEDESNQLTRSEVFKKAQKLLQELLAGKESSKESSKKINKKEHGQKLWAFINHGKAVLSKNFTKKETAMERSSRRRKEFREYLKAAEALGVQLEQEKAVVVQERDQIAEEKAQVVEERDQIAEEKAQVVEERDQIAEEKAQVVEERDQIAKRAELRDCIRKKLFRVLRREFSDNELLADIIEDKQDVIVDAAVKVSLAHSEHAPEKVVDALIEQVKSNGQRIVLEEGIAEDIINDGVSSFLTAVTVKPALSTTPKID